VEQQAASISGLSLSGSMPHLAAQENWTTTFTLVNKGMASVQALISLFGDPSGTLTLPLAFPQVLPAPLPLLAASLDRTLNANASLIINTAGPQTPPVRIGAAQMAATGAVDGFAIFRQIVTAQEAVVPLETRNASSYLLAFDNTGGVVLGVALENVSAQAANVAVVIRPDTGTQIGTPGSHHSAHEQWPHFVRVVHAVPGHGEQPRHYRIRYSVRGTDQRAGHPLYAAEQRADYHSSVGKRRNQRREHRSYRDG
jgi:hypothetical protein